MHFRAGGEYATTVRGLQHKATQVLHTAALYSVINLPVKIYEMIVNLMFGEVVMIAEMLPFTICLIHGDRTVQSTPRNTLPLGAHAYHFSLCLAVRTTLNTMSALLISRRASLNRRFVFIVDVSIP